MTAKKKAKKVKKFTLGHAKNCPCEDCHTIQYERSKGMSEDSIQFLIELRKSERITGEDLAIRINV